MAVLCAGRTQPMNLIGQWVYFGSACKRLAGDRCSATSQYFSPLGVILLLQCKQGVIVACLISQGAVMESCRGALSRRAVEEGCRGGLSRRAVEESMRDWPP